MKHFYLAWLIILVFTTHTYAQKGILKMDTSTNGTVTFSRYDLTANQKKYHKQANY